jgi:hypothetical protein
MYHHVTFLLWITFVQEWMKEETVMHDRNIRVFVPTNSAQRGRIGQGYGRYGNTPSDGGSVLPAEGQVGLLESGCLHDVAYVISNYECV